MLYFDQLSSDRFGTVRQQIWSLLHYPLHMAILLCVEGNTSLIVWNSAVQALKWIWTIQPKNYADPAAGFADTPAFLSYLDTTMNTWNARFSSKYWNSTYDWNQNFTVIENYTATYGFQSEDWNNKTGDIVRYMFDRAQVFVFEAHSDSLAKLNAVTTPASSPRARLEGIFDVFNVTVIQFYIGGGAMLLVLALMYWFNKLHKTKYEFGEMINRVVVGFTLMIVGIAAVISNKSTTGFKFAASQWIIAIMVLCFVAGKLTNFTSSVLAASTNNSEVLALDNLLLGISHHIARRAAHRSRSWGGSTMNDDNDTTGLISKYPSNTPNPNSHGTKSSISTVQTAYTPYDTPVHTQDFATPRDRSRGASPDPSEGSVHEDAHAGSFSYHNTPISAMPGALGLNFATTPSLYSNHDGGKDKSKQRGGYESITGSDADDYDGHDYGHDLTRVPAHANGTNV